MKILWKSHPTKPEMNGQTEHVARELATVAIGYGQAEACPLPRYGTDEYLQMKAEQAAQVKGPAPGDVVPPGTPSGTAEWGVKDKGPSSLSTVQVWKRVSSGEVTWYAAPPDDCPESVRRRFEELKGANDAAVNAGQLIEAKSKQYSREQVEKTARWGAIFGK